MNWDDLPVSKDQVTVLALVAALVASAILAPAMAGVGGPDLESGTVNTETPAATEAPREGTSYTASSDGMNDVPESYVVNDIGGVVAPNVSTSAGSQTMQVDASGTADDPQLTLTDDQNHEGRVVAIDVAWFKDTIGHVPDLAYVRHESGTTYAQPISVEGSEAKFAVHEFSTNDVTFSGEFAINATPAQDGDKFTYDSSDGGENLDINVTGSTATEWDNESATGVSGGDSTGISVGGNLDPIGPSTNDKPEIEVTGTTLSHTEFTSYSTRYDTFGDGINSEMVVAGWNSEDNVTKIEFEVGSIDSLSDYTVDIYINENGADGSFGDGTLVKSGYTFNDGTAVYTVPLDTVYNPSGSTIVVEFVTTSAPTGESGQVNLGGSQSSTRFQNNGGTSSSEAPDMTLMSEPLNVEVSADDGSSATIGTLSDGETQSAELNVTTPATQLDWKADGGSLDYTLKMKERTQTVDPVVDVNGNTTSYSGTLADGEEVSLTKNDSWIESGTNNVTVTVGDGTLSSDAPTSEADLDYSHDVVEDRSVDYSAEAWSERYQVSKTWAEDTDNATLRIPWASDRVVGLRDIQVEYYDDAGNLDSSTSNPDYYFDGGDLVVELGDVPAGWETVVDADGTKVQVEKGNITVLEPTAQGSTLDSKISIDDKSSGFYVAVGGTDEGSQVHYLHNESWSGADGYADFDSNGNQHVYMPNAAAGSETRLRTLPLEFAPETGNIHVRVPEDRVNETEPVYKVSPGASDGDEYSITFLEAADGEDYVLYDETNGIALDSGTASSPLTLSDDNDDEAIIQFQLDDGSTTSSDGGGSSEETGPGIFDGSDSRNTGFLLVVAAVLAALAFIARGDESPVREAGDDIADSVEGISERVPVVGPLVGGVVASATRAASQGASALLNNRDAAVLLGAGVVLGAIQTGVIDLGPQDTAIVGIVIASLGSLIGLRRLDEFTFKRWALVNVLAGVVALQAVGEEAVLTAIVDSDVFPLIAIGGGVLLYLTIKGLRESQKEPDQNIIIQAESDD